MTFQIAAKRVISDKAIQYITVFLTPLLALVILVRPWNYRATYIFPGSGDMLWLQAITESIGRVGVFGTDANLAWPQGNNQWNFPQLGITYSLFAWISQNILNFNAIQTMYVGFCFGIALTSVATYFMLRQFCRSQFNGTKFVFALALALSPYFVGSLIHLNLLYFYLIPLTIGIAIKIEAAGGTYSGSYKLLPVLSVFVLALSSPMWWVIVGLFLFLVLALVTFLQGQLKLGIRVLWLFIGIFGGAIVQYSLYMNFRIPNAITGRGTWDSNTYGGHLVDLILGSKILNFIVPGLANLQQGGSIEFKYLGTACAFAALISILMVLAYAKPNGVINSVPLLVKNLSLIGLLLFLLGGFGNLITGVSILVGFENPARVWSRLSILMALLGFVWIIAILSWFKLSELNIRHNTFRRFASGTFISLIAVSVFAELVVTKVPAALPVSEFAETSVVTFLKSEKNNCPVAQLPQNGVPGSRQGVVDPLNGDFGGYAGLAFYVIDPTFQWSIGSWVPGSKSTLNSLGEAPSLDQMHLLGSAGYCAVVYDKLLAATAQEANNPLEGTDLSSFGKPNFTNSRYEVFLLES